MRRKLWLITLGIITVISCSTFCFSQNIEDNDTRYKPFSENGFSFDVPENWNRMDGEFLSAFRQQYETQSKQNYQQYYGTSEGYEWGVPFLCGFLGPEKETFFIAVMIKIPPQAENYLDEVFARTNDIIEWGISQGQVKKVFGNELKELNGMSAHFSDLLMGDDSRMISYGIYFSEFPDRIIQISMIARQGKYDMNADTLKHMVESLRIDIKN